MNQLHTIAVMIDADNAPAARIADVLHALSLRGRIVAKRAYGNWRKDPLKSWVEPIKQLAIRAEQQFDYVAGKNATDIALAIDAMELLHTGRFDAFAIVSSDSDYTPLAIKLREYGAYVFGVGEAATPESFRNACDEFLFLNSLFPAAQPAEPARPAQNEKPKPSAEPVKPAQAEKPKSDKAPAYSIDILHELILQAYLAGRKSNGFINAACVGSYIRRVDPHFDSRKYGFKTMAKLLSAFPEKYIIDQQPSGLYFKCLR